MHDPDAQDPICERCFKLKGDKRIKFTRKNNATPRDPPDHLPVLTIVEEALIARAAQHIQVFTGTGGNLKYRGHVCCFPQEVRAADSAMTRPAPALASFSPPPRAATPPQESAIGMALGLVY